MCERIEVGRISVAFQRDESVRVTEVIIINHNDEGQEMQGMRVICNDDGFIAGGVCLYQGVDIVGHAEMRG